MGLGNGAVFKLVPEHFPKDTGTVTGLVGALGGLGGFFPPLLLGVFRDQLGVDLAGLPPAVRDRAGAARGQPARVPSGRRRVDAVAAGGRAAGARARPGRRVGDARHGRRWPRPSSSARATCSTSTRRSSATRSRRSSRRSASPIATRCGCSGRRRAMYWRRGWQAFFTPRCARPATPSSAGSPRRCWSSPPTASSSAAAGCAGSRTG